MSNRNTREKILDYIIAFEDEKGYLPTLREVAQAVGLNSCSTVQYHIRRLKQSGLLTGAGRHLEVTFPEEDLLPESRKIPLLRSDLLVLPAMRKENVLRYVSCPDLPGTRGLFALKVSNTAMTGAAVVPGDMVVVDPTTKPGDGDLAAILLERSLEVRLLRTLDGESWYAPANQSACFREIAKDGCTLLGRVKSVVRQY